MNNTHSLKPALLVRILAGSIAALLAAPTAQADTYYWDVDGTTPGFSTVVGAWDGTNAFWNTDSTGGAGGSTTATTLIADDLNFVTATVNTGSITLSNTQNANSLTYGSTVGAITLTGGILNLAPAATITTNSVVGMLHSIASTISGAATSLTKAGVGTLALTTTNTSFNPGEIIISGGVLRIGNNTATTLNSGSYAGNITNNGTLQLWSTLAQILSGNISGSGGINKAYGGTLTLSGANTYTGKSQFLPQTTAGFTVTVSSFNSVNGGTPLLASSSLGAPTTIANGTIDVGDTGKQAGVNLTYVAAATGETTDRVINIGFNGTDSQTITANNSTGVLRFTSAFTANTGTSGQLILRGTGAGQIDQGLPQIANGGLNKSDAGSWTLGGSGNFTGPTKINGGLLSLSSATALRLSPFDTTSVAGTATVGLKIATTTLSLGGLNGANSFESRFTTVSGGYSGLTALALTNPAGTPSTHGGGFTDNGNSMTLTKSGVGTQFLNGVNAYTGLTTVSQGTLGSGGSFAGAVSVGSATFSPGNSFGAIGTLTINNATASALTLTGSNGIFDLPSTVTTPDQVAITGGGGLVLNGTNTVILQTAITGTPEGTYDLMTFTGAHTGAGSLVFANGSTTRGNASLSVSAGLVRLTVAAGGLGGTSTFNAAGAGATNTDNWSVAGNWNSGVVPTGTTNATLAPTSGQVQVNSASTPTFSGDLTINPGVTLNLGFVTNFAENYNALGTPGTTVIFMGSGSTILTRTIGTPTFSDIVLLGNASISAGSSTTTGAAMTFRSITGPYAFNLNTHGIGGAAGSANFTMANSFTTLNLIGTGTLTTNAADSIGTATVNMGNGANASKISLNITGALTDSANPLRFNLATLEQSNGASVTTPLSLPNRTIELNGAGGATINNLNTLSSNANIISIGGGISSTAAGAKTLTLGGANTGLNTISGAIINGAAGTIALTKADAGTWVLSGSANTYTGTTGVSGGTLIMSGDNSLTGQITVSGATGATLTLSGDNSGMSSNVVLSTATGTVANSPRLNINRATALGTGILTLGGGLATDVVRIDNTSLSAVNVSTANAITMNRNFTFVGMQDLSLGTGTTTIGPASLVGNRSITVTAKVLTLNGTVAEAAANLGITKAGAGTLVLSGPGSSYTGSTVVSAGTLVGIGTNAFGNTTGISIAAASTATLSLRGDSSTSFVKTIDSSAYSMTTTANGATINVDQATIAGTGAKTMSIGTLGLNAAITNGTNFTGANNTSLSIGAVTTGASASGTETLTNSIASTGSLTLASLAVARTGTPTLAFTGAGNTTVTGAITQFATTALTKSGTGTLTLNGTSSYTGTTTVSDGTLNINGTLGAGANVVNANAGTTNFGVSQTLAALNIGAGAIVNLDSAAMSPAEGEGAAAFAGFGASDAEFGADGGVSGVAAVPEPGTATLLLGGLATLLGLRRRKA